MDIKKARQIIANYNSKKTHTVKEKRDFVAAKKVENKFNLQQALGM